MPAGKSNNYVFTFLAFNRYGAGPGAGRDGLITGARYFTPYPASDGANRRWMGRLTDLFLMQGRIIREDAGRGEAP